MDFGSEVEDDKGYLDELKGEDEEKNEDDLNEDSELEEEKDFEDDQIKSREFEGDLDQELPEKKEESIWDEIDWSEDKQAEREKTIWDEIDWSEDKQGEGEKNEKDNNDIRNEEHQEEEPVENYNENIDSQSTSTVLTSEIEEIESNMEHQEQEEEIEIRKEEYQEDTEPIVNTDESEFIKDVEELAEYVRETKAVDESVEPQAEKENAAYYAEQYYETLKEKEVLNEQDSKEEQETEELRQEVTEELKVDQESGYKSNELEKEDISESSKEITSTEEFEYLWEVRDILDREGKPPEEIEEVMHEAEEMYETLKNAEKLYEEQELEKLKLVDHEDEATEEDLKENFDRVDLVKQAVELEEKLIQQGVSQKEIDTRVEESIEETIETAEFEEKLEKIIEKQELEKLKLVDHEDEATEEDLKENLDRVDLVEQAVELEEKLVQRGKSQEEIDVRVEESIETTKFEEKLEKIIEEQELEKLKLVDHEDEATEEDLKEELNRIDLLEQAVELEEELFQQGELQDEIDARVEKSIETTKLEESLEEIIELEQESIVNEKLKKHDLEINELNSNENVENEENLEVLKPELDAIESESEGNKDFLEESTKFVSEESDEEESEHLQELYRQETGRRPIYSRKKTKGYSQWLEQRELGVEKIKKSISESDKIKEIKEEDWKTTLNQWIKEASEEVCNAEFKSELKKALESYNAFEDLTRKFMKLYEKGLNEKLSEKEKDRLKSLTDKLHELDPIQFELLTSIFFIKKYITEQYWHDFWNKPLVNRVISKFFKHISQKCKNLKKEQKIELEEYIDSQQELEDALEEYRQVEVRASIENEELEKEYEQVKQIYRRQTGRRPINKGEQTKGFSQWLEERKKKQAEKIENSEIYNFINIKTDSFQKDNETFMVQKYNFNKEEIEFLFKLKIDPNTLKKKWEWMDKNLIDKYFKFVFGPYLLVNPRLRSDDFKVLGFDSFLRRLERKSVSYRFLKTKIPISQEILENMFNKQEFKLKIDRVSERLRELEELGYELPQPKLYSEVIVFLNLKKNEIVKGHFIPSLNNILEGSHQVKDFFEGITDKQKIKTLKQRVGLAVRRWIQKNPDLPFRNLQELKKHFKLDKTYNLRGLTEIELINLVEFFIEQIKAEILKRYKGVKKEIIYNNKFNEYFQFLTNNKINNIEILEIVLDKTSLQKLFNNAKLYEGGNRWRQGMRCLQTIALAVLKCSNYNSLRQNLKLLTKLKDGAVTKLISEYIPMLKKINSKLDVNKWLYNNNSYSLRMVRDLVRDTGLKKTGREGVLKEPINEEEFNKLLEIYSPSFVPLKISCGHSEHPEFDSTGNRIQQKHWCRYCSSDAESQINAIITDIVIKINTLKSKGLKDNEIIQLILSESFITDFSKSIKKKGYIHSTQIQRIIQVISLALLSSSDYYSLNESLKELTGLSDNQVWRNINEYIPLLSKIFPDIDADKWLLEPHSPIPRSVVKQFKRYLKEKVKAVEEGVIEVPLIVEKIRVESVQNKISSAKAIRLAHNIMGENYDKYFQSPTQYDRKTFITELEKILEKRYHIGTDFILKLYKLTNLIPNEFVQHFYPKASGLIEALRDNVTFRRKDTLTNIRNFIEYYFSGIMFQYKEEALEIYNNYLHLREIALIDKRIPFDFIYLENRIRRINVTSVRDSILNFFASFAKKKNPVGIFCDERYTRASLIKLRGNLKRPIFTNKVLDYFKKELKIIRNFTNSPLFQLGKICKEVYASNLAVDHPKVLGRILLDYYDSFASEIPVWKLVLNDYITGHIDILLFDGSNLIIGDYKRNIREIKEGLPQICVYAALLKSVLLKYSPQLQDIKIKCIGFCEELVIEFDPEVLGPKLLSFIQNENRKRVAEGLKELMTMPTAEKKIRKSLYNEFKKAIS